MRRINVLLAAFIITGLFAFTNSKTYKIGDSISDFELKNIDNSKISLSTLKNNKGAIIVFTCNHCPYAKAYEDRIIELGKKYKETYPVLAINPNDPTNYPEDDFEHMVKRAQEKSYTFPYLLDDTQEVASAFGATKTPHVYLLKKEKEEYILVYIGAIDDNYHDASQVRENYLENAINELEAGNAISQKETKAIGCSIKWKQ